MIIEGQKITRELKLKTHSLVIGTGAGGGVAAFELAAAGIDTLVLEEGGYFQAQDFNQREEDMMPALYRSGGQQKTSDGMISVFQGSCFGGSTVVNTADCTPIESEVLKHWQRDFGLDELTEEALESSYERVYKRLNVHRLKDHIINRNNGFLVEHAKTLGYKAGIFDSNRKGCIGSGYCYQGCAYNAKRGTNLSYLPQASELGANIYTDVRADKIERLNEGRYRIHASIIDRQTRAKKLPVTIEAERIVMAAGSVHTPAILKRSGFGKELPQLGKNISLQPQILMSAQFGTSELMRSWRGAPQSTYVSEFDDNRITYGLGGFRLEGLGGLVGILSQQGNLIGEAHKQQMKAYPNTQFSALLVPDQPTGEMNWAWDEADRVKPMIDYTPTSEWKQRLKDGMKTFAEFYFSAGAKNVTFGSTQLPVFSHRDQLKGIDNFSIEPGNVSLTSAHVQGSCRIGVDAESGVVDQNLKLHTGDNIYVVDGSVMPTSASTHTMIPIMVMADRAMHLMLQ